MSSPAFVVGTGEGPARYVAMCHECSWGTEPQGDYGDARDARDDHNRQAHGEPPMPFGTRVIVPTVEGSRDRPTHALYQGPDDDNPGYHRVVTERKVMGEYLHSLPWEDIEPVAERFVA